jgi:hypothetical protein
VGTVGSTSSYLDVCRFPHCPTTSRVVESSDEGPEEFDASGEELAEIGQSEEEERNSDDSIDDRQGFSSLSFGVNVAIT